VVLANGFMLSRKYYYSSQYMREPGKRVEGGVGEGLGGEGENSLTLFTDFVSFCFSSNIYFCFFRLYVIFIGRQSQVFVMFHKYECTVLTNHV